MYFDSGEEEVVEAGLGEDVDELLKVLGIGEEDVDLFEDLKDGDSLRGEGE